MSTSTTVAELREQLRLAESAERAEREAKLAAFVVQYSYTLESVDSETRWQPVFDDTCSLYRLSGRVVNKAECDEIGKSTFEGSMVYVFNSGTGKIITSVGGGSIFTTDPECMSSLGDFITTHPDGGDVTEIVFPYTVAGKKGI